MLVTFVKLFVLSFFIGLSIGCIGSLCLKKLKAYNIGRENECTLICLFAYFSYILTEQFEMTPIIVLLFNIYSIHIIHFIIYHFKQKKNQVY